MTTDTSGPAFPIASDVIGHSSGMTLRDYVAAQCLAQAFGATVAFMMNEASPASEAQWVALNAGFSKRAFAAADAFLAARTPTTENSHD